MAELSQWLRTEARRQAARPDLLAAVLSGGSFAYARYRLGFMSLRMLLRSGLHAIEIQLLVLAFVPWGYVAPLLAYRALCSLAGAAHWGALEVMRARVRDAAAARRPEQATAAIARAFGLTLWAAAAAIVVVLGIELAATLASGQLDLRAAYAVACVLRLGSDSALRALHSGVFALRRVHRPLWSSVAPDVVELACFVLGFGDLGLWSIPLAILAGGATDAALSFVFVRRAYRQRRLRLPGLGPSLRAARSVHGGEAAPGMKHAAASVTLQLDGVLLLVLAQAGHAGRGPAAFAALYYVVRPLLAASTHWVRTFYFDLKLVDSGALRAVRPRLIQFLERLGIVWSLILAAVTLAVAHFVLEAQAGLSLLVLIPFFVARSAFAVLQIIAFGEGNVRRLLQTGGIVLAGLLALPAFGWNGMSLLGALSALLAAIVFLARRWGAPSVSLAQTGLLDHCAWLAALRSAPPSKLAVLQVDARSARVGALLRGLRLAYPALAITRWGRRFVLLTAASADVPSLRSLVLACGGALQNAWVSEGAEPATLFEQAARAGALPDGWTAAATRALAAANLEALARDFPARFAGGEVFDLHGGRSLSVRPVNPSTLRDLVAAIQARSRGREARSERALPFNIAVYAPEGQARAVFIADKSTPGFDAFRAEAHAASVRASWPELWHTQALAARSQARAGAS